MTHRVRGAFGRFLALGYASAVALLIAASSLAAHLPVDGVRQVVAFQPGVVASGSAAGVSIRGGRPGEANVYIDGAPVRGTNSGAQRITVSTNALEEASVTTGALGVEFSDAQSGVISYTTKAGSEKITGSVSSETDEPFGNSMSVGFNRFEGSLGGPVPNVKNLRWFGSAVVQGQSSDFRGKDADTVPVFIVAGIDAVVPDTAADGNVTQTVLPRFGQ